MKICGRVLVLLAMEIDVDFASSAAPLISAPAPPFFKTGRTDPERSSDAMLGYGWLQRGTAIRAGFSTGKSSDFADTQPLPFVRQLQASFLSVGMSPTHG